MVPTTTLEPDFTNWVCYFLMVFALRLAGPANPYWTVCSSASVWFKWSKATASLVRVHSSAETQMKSAEYFCPFFFFFIPPDFCQNSFFSSVQMGSSVQSGQSTHSTHSSGWCVCVCVCVCVSEGGGEVWDLHSFMWGHSVKYLGPSLLFSRMVNALQFDLKQIQDKVLIINNIKLL